MVIRCPIDVYVAKFYRRHKYTLRSIGAVFI